MYYKVVLNQKGILKSAISHLGNWTLTYTPNVETLPIDNSRIFIFSDIESAQYFLRRVRVSRYQREIWECEATGVSHIPPVDLGMPISESEEGIREYWDLKKKRKKNYLYTIRWNGSLSAKSVTLLRKIL